MSKKILFVGYNMQGFGGQETACKALYHLLMEQDPTLKIAYLFIHDFRGGCKEVNDDWLRGIPFSRITSRIHHTKLRRIHFAYLFSKIVKAQRPDIVIAIDPLSCYVTSWSKKFSFVKFDLYAWIHQSLTAIYKAAYALQADYHLSISDGNSRELIKKGVDKNKIFTIYNPIKRTEDILPRPESVASFIYMGRLADEGKNVYGIFKALSSVTGEYKLHIVGSGSYEKTLQEQAKALAVNVAWHGWQIDPWDYVKKNIAGVSALLLNSNSEGFPMVLLEAIARGIYCLSTDCETGPASIINDQNGELYPVGDCQALADKLQAIINGKSLPATETIKQSINHLYADKYIERVFSALKIN